MAKPEAPYYNVIAEYVLFLYQSLLLWLSRQPTQSGSTTFEDQDFLNKVDVIRRVTNAEKEFEEGQTHELTSWFDATYQSLLKEIDANPNWADLPKYQQKLNKIWGDSHLRPPHPRERKLVRQHLQP